MLRLVLVTLYLCGLSGAAFAQAESYTLGENDQIRVIAPAAPGIAGSYLLGEGGRIALPTAETVTLGDLTLNEAAERIRRAVETQYVEPIIGVELEVRRPFYITGNVSQPGAYPGANGLTLDRAVALAGGNRRNVESDQLTLAVTEIRSHEELDRASREKTEAEYRLLRMQAELAGASRFSEPSTTAALSQAEAAALLERETAILAASTTAYEQRLTSIDALLEARKAEIGALNGRLAASARQSSQIDKEIADTRTLLGKGLAPVSRLNGLMREADRQQSDTLQVRVLLNQALQAVAQLELDKANAPLERTITLTERMTETQARIAVLARSIDAATQLLDESGGQVLARSGAVTTIYRIQHADGSAPIETGDGTLLVLPGDLVTVLRGSGVSEGVP